MSAVSAYETWRRPGCTLACVQRTVLVLGDRAARSLEQHDPDAHEAFGAARSNTSIIQTGPLVLDRARMTVAIEGVRLNATPLELRLLAYLGSRLGHICLREDILVAALGWEYRTETSLLRTYVGRVRYRLGAAGTLVRTGVGYGYELVAIPPCSVSDIPLYLRALGDPDLPPTLLGTTWLRLRNALRGGEWLPLADVSTRLFGAAGYHDRERVRVHAKALRERGYSVEIARGTLDCPTQIRLTAEPAGVRP